MTLQQRDDEPREYPVVILQEEGVLGIIIKYGAFASVVQYYKDGISYEILVENSDIL